MPTRRNTTGAGRDGPTALENLTLWQRVHTHLREEILSGELPAGSELQEVALVEDARRQPRADSRGASGGWPRRGSSPCGRAEAPSCAHCRATSSSRRTRCARRWRRWRCASPCRSSRPTTSLRWSARSTRCPPAALPATCRASSRRTPLSICVFFDAAGNRMLADLYRHLRAQIDRHRLRSLELRGDVRRSIAEHKAILRAAKAGDVERAVHLVSEHIRVPQIRLLVEDHLEPATEAAG